MLEEDCLKLEFQESYVTKYEDSDFVIEPIIHDGCEKCFFYSEGVFFTNEYGLAYDSRENQIYVKDWSALQDNTWQTIKFRLTISVVGPDRKIRNQTHEGHFNLIVGEVNFVYTPFPSKSVEYNEEISIDYSNIYDPYQPYSASFEVSWKCPETFPDCDDFGTVTNVKALDRITKYQMQFGHEYEFRVTIVNTNSKRDMTSTDVFIITLLYPESTDDIKNCIDLGINLGSSSLEMLTEEKTSTVIFDNNNYTDIDLHIPTTSLSECEDFIQESNAIVLTLAVLKSIHFTGVDDDYFIFNDGNQLHLDQQELFEANHIDPNSHTNQTIVTFYAFLATSDSTVTGYIKHALILEENEPTLFANTRNSHIVVGRDQTLYIDGGNSEDLRDPNRYNYQFNWGMESYDYKWINHYRILNLHPTQRSELDINQPGKFYTYNLYLKDATRLSDTTYINVQVAPEPHPDGCGKVQLAQEERPIMAYTSRSLTLNAVTIMTCQNAKAWTINTVKWESETIDWKFWSVSHDSLSISISQEAIQNLPMFQDIKMKMTLHYYIDDIEYIDVEEFIIKVAREDLVGEVDFLSVVNRMDDDILLDASDSYDPENENSNDIECSWECPHQFSEICTQHSGCLLEITNDELNSISSVNSTIVDNIHQFKLTLQKGDRKTIEYYHVSVVETPDHPNCFIQNLSEFDLNSNNYLEADCFNINENTTYKWEIHSWSNNEPFETTRSLQLNDQLLKIAPYTISDQEAILVKVTVDNQNGEKTTVGKYYKLNNKQYFKRGNLQLSQQSVSAFLTEFQLTPIDWDSEISYTLLYQIRIQEAQDQYRVLQSKTMASLQNPVKMVLPPNPYDSKIYIDIFDAQGNFISESRDMESEFNLYIIPPYFAMRITDIVFYPVEQIDSKQFEKNFYNLMINFQAYANDYIDFQDYSSSYFKTLSEITVDYLKKLIIDEKELDKIVQDGRKILLRQHTIDILYFITLKHRDLAQNRDILSILDKFTSSQDQYYLGSTFIETSNRAMSIIFQTMDNIQDDLQNKLLNRFLNYIFQSEQEGKELEITKNNRNELSYKAQHVYNTKEVEVIYDVDIDESVLKDALIENGFVMMSRNNTFVSISIMNQEMNQVIKTNLKKNVTVTFRISEEEASKLQDENANFYCKSREFFNEEWSGDDDNIIEVDFEEGVIVCEFNHLSQYTLFLEIEQDDNDDAKDYRDPLNPPQESDFSQRNSIYDEPETFNDNGDSSGPVNNDNSSSWFFTFVLASILVVFILSTLILFISKQNDKVEDDHSSDTQISPSSTLWKKRFLLYIIILKQFNPFINLLTVRNKFLGKWIRNIMLQVYFLSISVFFLIVFFAGQNNSSSSNYVLFGSILIALVIFLRPLVLKLFHRLFQDTDAAIQVQALDQSNNYLNGDKEKSQSVIQDKSQNQINNSNAQSYEQQEEKQRLSMHAVNKQENYIKEKPQELRRSLSHNKIQRFSGTKSAKHNNNTTYSQINNESQAIGKAAMIGEDTLVVNDLEDHIDCHQNDQERNNTPFKSEQKLNEEATYEVKELHYEKNEQTNQQESQPNTAKSAQEQLQSRQNDFQSQRYVQPQKMVPELDQQTEIDEKEHQKPLDPTKLLINRIIGIMVLVSLWSLLVVTHFFVLNEMHSKEQSLWLATTFFTFLIIQFIVDPLLYFWLASSMITKDSSTHIDFFLAKSKDRKCTWALVKLFIGYEKMSDLSKRMQTL